jgi:beta-lactam-binding protein with PASTA domain
MGLNYTVSYVASNELPGTVVSQHPYGGARVDPASKVLLTVSGTQAALTIPNVIGQSQAQAEASLSAAGLDAQVVMKPGESSTPGTVVDESPVAGSSVSPQSIVVLTVS